LIYDSFVLLFDGSTTNRTNQQLDSICFRSHFFTQNLFFSCPPETEANRSFSKNASFDFDTDPDNSSHSFETFETPSAKLQQQTDKEHDLRRTAQVRQSLFQFDPLTENPIEDQSNGCLNESNRSQYAFSPVLSTTNKSVHDTSYKQHLTVNSADVSQLIHFGTPNITNGKTPDQFRTGDSNHLNATLNAGNHLLPSQSVNSPNGLNTSGVESKENSSKIMADFQQLTIRSKELEQQMNELKMEKSTLIEQLQSLQQENSTLQQELAESKRSFEEMNVLNRSLAIAFDQTMDTFEIELQNRDEQLESLNFRYVTTLKDKEQTAEDLQGNFGAQTLELFVKVTSLICLFLFVVQRRSRS
jgi:hypothetical protein